MSHERLVERVGEEIAEIHEIVTRTEGFLRQKALAEALPYREALSGAIALNLQSFYTGVERILEAIAREIDGALPSGEGWHRQLLEQMCLDLPEVRPPVISESTRTRLDEFRRFRHVVRSIYAYRLETSRVIELAGRVGECHREFDREIR